MRKRGSLSIMGKLIVLVRPMTGFMLLAILLGVLGHLCAIFIPVLAGDMLLLAGGQGADGLSVLFLLVAVLAAARGILHYGEQTCNHYIAFKILALIREQVFTALRRLCPAKLEGRERGNLITVLTGDIELLEVFYAHTISPAAIAVTVSVCMTAYIGSFHWLLGLIAALGYLTVGAALPLLTSRFGKDTGAACRAKLGELSSFYIDSLRGLREVLQFGAGRERLDELGRRTDSLERDHERLKTLESLAGILTGACILLFTAGMLTAAFFLRQRGVLTFAGVLLPTVAMLSSFGPAAAIANLSSSLSLTLAAGERVLELLEEMPETPEIANGKIPDSFTGCEVDDLTFSYEETPVLQHISLSIPEGKIIAVSGKSGSGKSTLLRLLMRFWAPPQSTVSVSGQDVNGLDTGWLRKIEGYVTQDTDLFQGSIAENILIGRLSASRGEVIAAAKKASIHDFIAGLPKGYDTLVGELGDTLSSGERQRIGLARAFLHDAPLLLLDEPTSNLDSLNEGIILKALREERAGRTVVLVSHRKSTIGIADGIYAIDGGRMR
ncbi:MAG: putative transporter ATP-binding protein [Oscillospiraceae bacterium]|nr:putative transporter ATP-binding protein [Oscillospiraceae bacterium]